MLGRYVPIARARFPATEKREIQNVPKCNAIILAPRAIPIPEYAWLQFSCHSDPWIFYPPFLRVLQSICEPRHLVGPNSNSALFFNGRNFTKQRNEKFKKFEKRRLWRFSIARSEGKSSKNHQIPTLGCSVCGQNLEGRLKFVLHIWFIARFGEIFSGYSWFSECSHKYRKLIKSFLFQIWFTARFG